MNEDKILILGGSGFLGSNLKKHFKNYNVLAPTHKELDLVKIKNVESFITKHDPFFIIYTAGISRIDEAEDNKKMADLLNHIIPQEISKFSSSKNIPFIYISTDAVFDGYQKKFKFKETDKPKPISEYGKSKLRGETKVLNNSRKNCVLRLITLYGKSEKPSFTLNFIETLKKGKEFNGIIDQVQNPLLVDIAVKGIIFTVEQKLTGIYHLGSLSTETNYEFLIKIAKKFNLNKNLIKKNTFANFTKEKKGHRKKKSVLICDKFVKASQGEILKTSNDSIEIFYKSMKLSKV